jgi:hypothetical protein
VASHFTASDASAVLSFNAYVDNHALLAVESMDNAAGTFDLRSEQLDSTCTAPPVVEYRQLHLVFILHLLQLPQVLRRHIGSLTAL